nr:protein NRT1/ PTR FAMILY 8.3-like [Physcomitrium patens]|eukprot:XP_024372616.1 protein NRT1/ PTR FAMILY 8.3-like [Physcomitrella patens]
MDADSNQVVPICNTNYPTTIKTHPPLERTVSLARDGSVDFRGNTADKRASGRLKANAFIIGIEIGERLAFYGISANLVTYLTHVLHEGTEKSAANVNNWIGTTFIAPLLGAFLADAFWGRFWTILICGVIYFVGLVMLTLSVTVSAFKPPGCFISPSDGIQQCPSATAGQVGFFYFALYLMSLGGGCMKPCIAAFGADQFDEEDKRENEMKKSFFNWWVFGISLGALVSATVLVYVQSYISWGWGFGTPTVLMGIYLVLYILGSKSYRHKTPVGSSFTQIGQVIVAAVRNFRIQVPADPALLYEVDDKESLQAGARHITHSNSMRFLDKAAVLPNPSEGSSSDIQKHSPWKLATVTEVEEVKLVLRLLPIWVAALIFQTPSAQISTFYTRQGSTLNVNFGPNFKIPAASLQSIIPITIVCLIPIYDRVFVPITRRFTGNVRGITMLQRIGIGIILSFLSMVCAAVTEVYRVKVAREHGLLDHPFQTLPLSVFILLPQYVLLGAAEVFTSTGALEFFYDQAPDSMRSLGTAVFLSTIGIGNFLSSILLSGIVKVTSLSGQSWIVDNLNRCRLDYFYWLLAGLMVANLCFFSGLARCYKYKQVASL